jgi:hypothetical protein
MKRGILVYDHMEQEWRIWIGQQAYLTMQGQTVEIRIHHRYFKAYLEKDFDWFVTLDNEVSFTLRIYEIYKIRINIQDNISVPAPF